MTLAYRVELDDLAAHHYVVTLTVPEPAALQRLSLPVWIPGSYMVREFAKHVLSIQARQGSTPRTVQSTGKASWEVACAGRRPLVVTMRVYAFDLSVRTAFLDTQRGFFNGTSLCLRVEDRTSEVHRLTIGRLPPRWRVATAMRAAAVDARGAGEYEAQDYDELVDHPFELGPFWAGDFQSAGVSHRWAVSGHWPDFDGSRLLADAQRICETQIAFWHPPEGSVAAKAGRSSVRRRAPMDRYLFLLNAVDDGYGGLEHRASTALIASRRDLPAMPSATPSSKDREELSDGYVTLLGLISHEYFHTWNVKRLKPRELAELDYSRENYTELLWFFEGFTSYYDDLMLVRAGLIDSARYLKLLSKTMSGVMSTPGRHVQSVAEASRDAWIKYYRSDENTPNATVSYYAKGALVALLADLRLRAQGGSLDGAMQRLWAASGAVAGEWRGAAGSIDEAMIAQALSAEAGHPMAEDLRRWVHGREELPLAEALATHGVSLTVAPATLAQRMGWRTQDAAQGVRVTHVLQGGVAHRVGLAAGDECWAVDGWRLRRADDLLRLLPPVPRPPSPRRGQAVQCLVARDQRVLTIELPAKEVAALREDARASVQPAATVQLSLLSDQKASAHALARRAAWLQVMPRGKATRPRT